MASSSTPTHAQLEASLASYDSALLSKDPSGELLRLDKYLRTELRNRLKTRRKAHGAAHLEKAELEDIMRWKLKRGKFRPTLMGLIAKNSPETVEEQTRLIDSLIHRDGPGEKKAAQDGGTRRKEAMAAGCKLKGVGPATCSALLSLFSEGEEAFMSDESLLYAAGFKGTMKYNLKEWEWFVQKMQDRKEKEGWESVATLEKAAWAWAHRESDDGNVGEETKQGGDGKRKSKEASTEREAIKAANKVKRRKKS